MADSELNVVATQGLGKNYRRRAAGADLAGRLKAMFAGRQQTVPAVRELTFQIRRSESVALIGENGAGKSTALKLILGILVPDEGTVQTLGLTPHEQRRRLSFNVGVVFGQRSQLLWDIPARSTFKLMKDLYQIKDHAFQEMCREVNERLELEPLLDVPVRTLSLGQRVRCELAAAVLHAPALLVLDEPTIGLDVSVKEQVRALIRFLVERHGTTVLLATHDFNDIKAVCDRAIVMEQGRVLFDGDLSTFRSTFKAERTIVAELEQVPPGSVGTSLQVDLRSLGARLEWAHPRKALVRCDEEVSTARVLALLLAALEVQELALHEADMESIVASIYRGQTA